MLTPLHQVLETWAHGEKLQIRLLLEMWRKGPYRKKNCSNDYKCLLCAEKGLAETRHAMGGTCPLYPEALKKMVAKIN